MSSWSSYSSHCQKWSWIDPVLLQRSSGDCHERCRWCSSGCAQKSKLSCSCDMLGCVVACPLQQPLVAELEPKGIVSSFETCVCSPTLVSSECCLRSSEPDPARQTHFGGCAVPAGDVLSGASPKFVSSHIGPSESSQVLSSSSGTGMVHPYLQSLG